MDAKPSNTPVIVITFSIVLIIAMICGMVVWLMQRSMEMNERLNERLLEVRLEEAKARMAGVTTSETSATDSPIDTTSTTLEALQAKLKATEDAVKREAEARRKAEEDIIKLQTQQINTATTEKNVKTVTPQLPQPSTAEANKPASPANTPSKGTVKEQTMPTQSVTQKPTKRKAPTETPAAAKRLGEDGYPRNRITLPMGNDELDWQL